jgi:hypothetical protein
VSLKVLVIPEDPTHNGYILKPLVQAVLADIGKPTARVQVLTSPRLTGYDHAREAISGELVDSYAHFDLWLFMPDADRAGAPAMTALENELRGKGITVFCCPAVPEVEIFACVAYRTDVPGGWAAARANARMKEQVFEPLRQRVGSPRSAGGGRDKMIAASVVNMQAMYQFCPEIRSLRDRIAAHLQGQKP